MQVSKKRELETYNFPIRDRESAVEVVLKNIRELLVAGKLKPGDRLPSEYELSEMMGISRGSIREAMKVLKAFGVIDIRQGNGTYVAEPSSKSQLEPLLFELILTRASVQEFIELRELIETGVIKLVLRNARQEDLKQVVQVHERFRKMVEEQKGTPKELFLLDIEFHRALGKATRNALLERIYRFVLDFFAPTIEKTYEREKTGRNALRLHQQILEALLKQDQERVLQALAESIAEWWRLFNKEEVDFCVEK